MSCSIVWLRDDLRVADNPALLAALKAGLPVVVVFILDEQSAGVRPLGRASKWWLHHSLHSLSDKISRRGGKLLLRRGPAVDVMRKLIRETGASNIFWNRRYGLAERGVDADVKEYAHASGLTAQSFHANVLFEPWTVRTTTGGPYTVFTPFWKSRLNQPEPPRLPGPNPDKIPAPGDLELRSDDLESWRLLPTKPDWAMGFGLRWTPGENGAQQALDRFLHERLPRYALGRDFPAENSTSELSPHLRWGEISPFQIWHTLDEFRKNAAENSLATINSNSLKFLAELGWREFSYHLLFHWPDLATENFDHRFDSFPWNDASNRVTSARIKAWQQGVTGVPMVDAGMRELWQTGYMHNRVRMVAASFLIKNLLVDWRIGEAWFWDTLVDADPASNAASWQWVAGSGADAAPYFRVFNPLLQAEKFDARHEYLHRYLGNFEDPDESGYPTSPLVDLAQSRQSALAAFETIRHIPRTVVPYDLSADVSVFEVSVIDDSVGDEPSGSSIKSETPFG